MKSTSVTSPRNWNRTRALKRKPSFREVTEADFRWFYGAYKMGNFAGMFQEGQSAAEFAHHIRVSLESMIAEGSLVHVLIAENKPVGLMLAAVSERKLEPHLIWFGWASPRQKVESVLNYLNEMRRMWDVFVFAEEWDKPFFIAMQKYGVLRTVGQLDRWFDSERHAMIYQTRQPEIR